MFSLTKSVGEHFQSLNPLIFMKLQTINTVKSIILYQIERRVHRHLWDTNTQFLCLCPHNLINECNSNIIIFNNMTATEKLRPSA